MSAPKTDKARDKCVTGSGNPALAACRQALRKGARDAEIFLAGAKLLRAKKNYADEVKLLESGAKAHPSHSTIKTRLAVAKSNLAEQEWARNKKSSSGGSGAISARLEKIRCLRRQGQVALSACEKALKVNPGDVDLHRGKGDALVQLNRVDDAIKAFKAALKVNPDDAQSKIKLAALGQAPLAPPPAPPPAAPVDPLIAKLGLLNDLKAKGLISPAEFDRRHAALLDSAVGGAAPPLQVATRGGTGPSIAAAVQEEIDFGTFYALVIGNNRYEFLPNLQTAVGDAKAIGDLLAANYGFKVKTLTNATRHDILKEMSMLRKTLTAKDNLLVYYAGHGNLDEAAGRGYWLPVDAEEDIKANWISNADLTDMLKASDARHAMVVADSCFSGTLVRSAPATLKGGGDKIALLTRLADKMSRTVMTSGGVEPVVDSGGAGHSVFAKAFLDTLGENTDMIEAQELFNRMRARVVVNADQTPEYGDVRKAGHDGGDFIFIPRGN